MIFRVQSWSFTGFANNHLKQPLKKLAETLHHQGTNATCQSLGARFSHVTFGPYGGPRFRDKKKGAWPNLVVDDFRFDGWFRTHFGIDWHTHSLTLKNHRLAHYHAPWPKRLKS